MAPIAFEGLMKNIPPETLLYVPIVEAEHGVVDADFTVPEGKDMYIYSGYLQSAVKKSTGLTVADVRIRAISVDNTVIKSLLLNTWAVEEVVLNNQKQDHLNLEGNPLKLSPGERIDVSFNTGTYAVTFYLGVFFLPQGTKFQ